MKNKPVYVYKGEALASYNFGEDHPFGPDRHHAFHAELETAKLGSSVHYASPKKAAVDELVLFHTVDYVDFVSTVSDQHTGYLDQGDTPIFPGVFEAASYVVGTTLAAVDVLMHGDADRAFIPIAGMHHAARDKAAGFCVFNDCGVAIEYLRKKYHIQRIAYIDIDAHHVMEFSMLLRMTLICYLLISIKMDKRSTLERGKRMNEGKEWQRGLNSIFRWLQVLMIQILRPFGQK